MKREVCLIGTVLILLLSSGSAFPKPSDDEIRRALVGSWIVPQDSSDRTPFNEYALESFQSDGTYLFYVYRDPACETLLHKVQVKWKIQDGILISYLAGGQTLRDEIVSINSTKMVLHSLDDGTTYTREKALTCSRKLIS